MVVGVRNWQYGVWEGGSWSGASECLGRRQVYAP